MILLGPFYLEIDFIAAGKDNEIKEESAYEVYKIPKYITNTWNNLLIYL